MLIPRPSQLVIDQVYINDQDVDVVLCRLCNCATVELNFIFICLTLCHLYCAIVLCMVNDVFHDEILSSLTFAPYKCIFDILTCHCKYLSTVTASLEFHYIV